MRLTYFDSSEWKSWDVERRPLITEGMPVLIDDDLLFEDEGVARPTVAANRWLQELPISGVPSPKSWKSYAQAVRHWFEFLDERQVPVFGERAELRAVLAAFAEYRLAGPLAARWDGSTWNHNIKLVARFYNWAVDEGLCQAVPFTYVMGRRYSEAGMMPTVRNAATVRRAKAHVTVKYLEDDYLRLFVRGLAGLDPDGEPDEFRGWHVGRNAAMGEFVASSGLRAQEFTYLLTYELPPLPKRRSPIPVTFPLAAQITKGKKPRATWVDYGPLAAMWQYVRLDRASIAERRPYRPDPALGEPLLVSEVDWEGGRVNGARVSWRSLNPAERMRLVDPNGSSPIVALQSDGSPFTDWGTVFRRTSRRIRQHYEPAFPDVSPHTLRHTFAMARLDGLVKGYYQQAAKLVADTDADAALALYLTKSDPLLVLRDLLGHSSVTTTEIYIMRLDVRRIYAEAYAEAGALSGLGDAEAEAAAEFAGGGED
ncbi:site-specific integrase [Catenulispora subtropica]|uniref:Site-specific integrase n=1 Tax=Catenulispora subtropica TaxID=450798 RepID=A0ABN2QWE8_9ACTN